MLTVGRIVVVSRQVRTTVSAKHTGRNIVETGVDIVVVALDTYGAPIVTGADGR